MHERIRTARRPMACDFCGLVIHPGERYRIVRDEYSLMEYREHIQCPGAPTVPVADPRPRPPKIRTNFNHAFCVA